MILEIPEKEEFGSLPPKRPRMAKAHPGAAVLMSVASLAALALAVGQLGDAQRPGPRAAAAPRGLQDPAPVGLPGFPAQENPIAALPTQPPPQNPIAALPTQPPPQNPVALPDEILPTESPGAPAVEHPPTEAHGPEHPAEGGAEAPGAEAAAEGHGAGTAGHEESGGVAEQHGSEHGEEGEGGGHYHVHGYMVLFFLFGGFGLGCFLQFLQERYLSFIPYTCMLFMTGFVLAAIHHFRPPDHWSYWHAWYESVELWQHIDPHTVLFVFLPALVFSEAMRLNIKLGKRLFAQVLILACPGVILGTVLTAAFSHYVLPYGWSWAVSLVFGSIMAATDPVAVVALFNTLGVSPRLTMIISGESLLNDGTAIVCFNLMMSLWAGEEVTFAKACQYFYKMTVHAVLLGMAMGVVGLIFVFGSAESRYHGDEMIQVAVTVCVGFLSFFIAEVDMRTSGVLSVVAAGVMFSCHAWPRFVSKEAMRTCWEFIEFFGNTIIFLLAGLLFGHRVLTRRESLQLDFGDLGWLFVLYIAATLIRLVMNLMLWPFLNCCGQKITWQELVVMTWSGLRGAVGLVLAISVDRSVSEKHLDPKVGSRIMFHVGGMAMLTILVNATLAGPLLQRLGFTKTEDIEEKCIEHFERLTDAHARLSLQQILESSDKDPRFDGAALDKTAELVPVLSSEPPTQEVAGKQLNAKLRVYREMFMRAVQHHYWEDIEGGLIPRTSAVARILLYSADACLDDPRKKLNDWTIVEETLDDQMVIPCLSKCCLVWPISSISLLRDFFPVKEMVVMWQIYAALSFIEAHKAAREEVSKHFAPTDVFGAQVQTTVQAESQAQCDLASELLERMPPDEVESTKSHMLAGKLLQLQVEKVTELKETGLLSEKGASHILHRLMDSQRNVSCRSSIKSISILEASPCHDEDDFEGESSEDSDRLLRK